MNNRMTDPRQWYIRTGDGSEYGPVDWDTLVSCARDGRIDSNSILSADQVKWTPATSLPGLELHWAYEANDGQFAGPFHLDFIKELMSQGCISAATHLYRIADPNTPPLADELKESQARILRLSDELKAAREQGKSLSASYEEARKQAIDLSARLNAAIRKQESFVRESDVVIKQKEREAIAIGDQKDLLAAQLAAAQAALATAQGTLATEQNALAAEREKCARLVAELKEARRQTASLSIAFENSQTETATQLSRGEQLASQLAAAQTALATSQAALATEQNARSTEQNALAAEREKCARLGAELSKAVKQRDDVVREKDEFAKQRDTVTKQRDAENAKVHNLQARLAEALDANARFDAALRDAQQHAAALSDKLTVANNSIDRERNVSADLTKKLTSCRKEKESETSKAERLQQRLEAAERKIKELEKSKKQKNPLQALFGGDSRADLSVLELAAQRELAAMKRPHVKRPVPPNPRTDVIDV